MAPCVFFSLSSLLPPCQGGVAWMLHIDSDELFYLSEGSGGVGAHFAELERMGCVSMLYPNHEGCPEQVLFYIDIDVDVDVDVDIDRSTSILYIICSSGWGVSQCFTPTTRDAPSRFYFT